MLRKLYYQVELTLTKPGGFSLLDSCSSLMISYIIVTYVGNNRENMDCYTLSMCCSLPV